MVHRRVMNRYTKLCLYMGMNSSQIEETRVRVLHVTCLSHACHMWSVLQVDAFCQLLSSFAMEYRTTHGKVRERMERKKQEENRNKTKGKFIVCSLQRSTDLLELSSTFLYGTDGTGFHYNLLA